MVERETGDKFLREKWFGWGLLPRELESHPVRGLALKVAASLKSQNVLSILKNRKPVYLGHEGFGS